MSMLALLPILCARKNSNADAEEGIYELHTKAYFATSI